MDMEWNEIVRTAAKLLLVATSIQLLSASAVTSNELVSWCQQIRKANNGAYYEQSGEAYCLGYFSGFSDMDDLHTAFGSSKGLCLRRHVTNTQAALVFLDYMDSHPEELDQPAGFSAFFALAEAFPCNTDAH